MLPTLLAPGSTDMAYNIDIPPMLDSLLEELPPRARGLVHLRLARLAEAAEWWPAGDLRWGQLARCEGPELRLYVEGCCLRLHLQSERRRLVVDQVGRVRLLLTQGRPAGNRTPGQGHRGISC